MYLMEVLEGFHRTLTLSPIAKVRGCEQERMTVKVSEVFEAPTPSPVPLVSLKSSERLSSLPLHCYACG